MNNKKPVNKLQLTRQQDKKKSREEEEKKLQISTTSQNLKKN